MTRTQLIEVIDIDYSPLILVFTLLFALFVADRYERYMKTRHFKDKSVPLENENKE